jgi:hypothetical protein
MAVFAEPSSGAQACVEIQRRILHLFEVGKFPLKVRMGLHLGQVTIEQKIGQDIFGRHVNKASRVEAMACGGQIFATYSVVETLKGHIEIEGVDFHSHGAVSAKGFKEKFEIFELLFLRSQKPKAPVGIKDKLLKPKALSLIGACLIALVLLGNHLIFPKLYFYNAPQVPLVLNHSKVLNLKKIENQKYVEIHEKIPLGKHFVYYQVSSIVRYYSLLEVEMFSEFIKPKYQYLSNPAHVFQLNLMEKKQINREEQRQLVFKKVTDDFKFIEQKVNFKSVQSIEKLDDGVKAEIEYEFEDSSGTKIKNSFEKILLSKESSFSHTINLSTDGEYVYSISIVLRKNGLKVAYRVDFKRIE